MKLHQGSAFMLVAICVSGCASYEERRLAAKPATIVYQQPHVSGSERGSQYRNSGRAAYEGLYQAPGNETRGTRNRSRNFAWYDPKRQLAQPPEVDRIPVPGGNYQPAPVAKRVEDSREYQDVLREKQEMESRLHQMESALASQRQQMQAIQAQRPATPNYTVQSNPDRQLAAEAARLRQQVGSLENQLSRQTSRLQQLQNELAQSETRREQDNLKMSQLTADLLREQAEKFQQAEAKRLALPKPSTPKPETEPKATPRQRALPASANSVPSHSAPRSSAPVLPKPSVTYSDQVHRHTVRPGESLSSIARMYRIPIDVVMNRNQIHNANDLKVGQPLLIPLRRIQ